MFDATLIILLISSLTLSLLRIIHIPQIIFLILSIFGLLPVLKSAAQALIKKHLTIDLLASIALIFAFFAGEWQSAGFINLMLAFARVFDHWTEMRTKRIIERLMKYRPEKVRIRRDEKIVEIPVENVKVNDEVIVEDGERVAVDGVVISGTASINESTLTGESQLVLKKTGNHVYAATLNEQGSIVIRAEKVGEDLRIFKIMGLIEGATRNRAKYEKVADRFTQIYILAMIFGAAGLYLFSRNTGLILSILLVVCADDIAVAVPLTFTSGIATSAKNGVLIKGSEVLEKLSRIKYFLTDKTGTLTRGKQKVTEVYVFGDLTKDKLIFYVSSVASGSRHPTDVSIVKYAETKNIKCQDPKDFNETSGEGVVGEVGGHRIISGRVGFLENNKIVIDKKDAEKIEEIKNQGKSLVTVGVDGKLAGILVMEDEVRLQALTMVVETKRLGVRSWTMLTGDNEKVAERVAGQVQIEKFEANLTPESKLAFIEDYKKKHKGIVAMLGDGVNDAPALALADLSIAMGAIGSDAAIEASDLTLMRDNLEKIPEAMIFSRRVMQVVRQNFWIWGATNAVGLILVLTGHLDPVGAATFNFVTDFFPIANSLKVNRFKMTLLR